MNRSPVDFLQFRPDSITSQPRDAAKVRSGRLQPVSGRPAEAGHYEHRPCDCGESSIPITMVHGKTFVEKSLNLRGTDRLSL
ncbi:MAG: hypothetical protein KY476_23075 [Planctomycetes bacterium]|nr:hypothetical protein [Planctomycetota bacterium]